MFIKTPKIFIKSCILLVVHILCTQFLFAQAFLLRSKPPGAGIFDKDDKSIGETPMDLEKIINISKFIKIKLDAILLDGLDLGLSLPLVKNCKIICIINY